ncbi:MAG: hypothetical protein E7254_02980 [Lachnospiraceae bacterium]|nr:hypothetical protein [Lachnospiraceae bacterium]
MKKYFENDFKRFIIKLLIVVVVLEVFLFNYKSHTINIFNRGKYNQKYITVNNAEISGLEENGGGTYTMEGENAKIIFDIDSDVKTMRLDAGYISKDKKNLELEAEIKYSYVGYTDFRVNHKSFYIMNTDKRTQYVTCASPVGIKQICVEIKADKSSELRIHGFSVNEDIPFHFSVARVLFLLLFFSALYLLMTYPAYRKPMVGNCNSQEAAIIAVMFFFLILIMGVFKIYADPDTNYWKQTQGNQITQEIVDALESGHTYLTDEVPQELLELDNPYDWFERMDKDVKEKWDHLLFEGKYYSYYGIGPVITLFLPYHLITGYYFSADLACFIFTTLGSLFLGMAYLEIIRKWYKKLQFRMVLLGLVCIEAASSILFSVRVTNFYEVAQSSGFCFLTIGFYLILRSNILTKEKIRYGCMFLSSVFMSLAVLSRALQALYAIVIVMWAVYGFFFVHKNMNIKEKIKYIMLFSAPYAFFGIIQMAYNYARFHNPFEFGISYTLTIYDYQHIQISLGLVMISVVNFLFTLPVINSQFPFVHGNMDFLGVNGYYFVAINCAYGLFATFVPAVSLLYMPKVAKKLSKEDKLKFGLLYFVPGILIPLAIVMLTWDYGYCMRYGPDFAWQMVLAILMFIFFVYQKIKNKTVKKWLFGLMMICTVWCLYSNLCYIISDNPVKIAGNHATYADVYSKIQNLVQFWR